MTGLIDILAKTSLFELPDFLSGTSAWDRHIPFAFLLVELTRPKCFVELGTHKGDSYLAFCQSVKHTGCETRCFAVDSWLGEDHSGYYGEEIYTTLRNYHDPRYAGFSQLIRGNFDSAVALFEIGSIDLLHIDGLHTYEAVRRDFETWRPKLSKQAIVLFHDTQVRERNFGVWRLWEEISAEFRHFEFPHGSGLGVALVGTEMPEKARFLFELTTSEQCALRQICEALGHRAALYGANQLLNSDLSRIKEEVDRKQFELSSLQAEHAETRSALIRERDSLESNLAALTSTTDMLQRKVSTIESSRVWRTNCFIRRLIGLR